MKTQKENGLDVHRRKVQKQLQPLNDVIHRLCELRDHWGLRPNSLGPDNPEYLAEDACYLRRQLENLFAAVDRLEMRPETPRAGFSDSLYLAR
jgi:hypothetical protein